ncbi:IS1634 family transposase [Hydrogenimonas thermophila]|uniref:IS1634 family transposase n=1 Tax=Hydrogenimonas thermophila TaxID=223786 RepID=UPI00293730D6|nr:IS1634 family transposase [Hydrogenimonas thermophila]WOE68848.1 IS1634 family transposase [Hydrogenimonas thermophila]WOE69469.1 IS1634 family transposase [Hydrogenimonas thermophila]WOE70185.1 IS1634 family transposase [Hydrogenimonas thermophila]WOE70766.1 IS1634 family transposase [Hydrogenimonas thermophila]WOE70844.1 IS1634 family transposase [Hydrogenimonas thermophila]
MFIREKRNPSGSVSIQIIEKKKSKYKVVETIGCASDKIEKELLLNKAKKRLQELQPTLFDSLKNRDEREEILGKRVDNINIENDLIVSIGGELIFGKIIKDIGCKEYFKKVKIKKSDKRFEYFKDLIVSRILYSGSKLYFIDYQNIFRKKDISVYSVYRLLDKIFSTQLKEEIEKCIFNHTLKLLNEQLVVSFYDVTTLHFESENEDDLRRVGFSKEGKLNRPQIQLGLLTTLEGYPLAYEVYEGNKFEGHTLIETLENFQKRFDIKSKPIVVADRGMLNNCNLIELDSKGYKYIIGSRIKSLKDSLKEQIANLTFVSDSETKEITLDEEIICKEKNKIKAKRKIAQRLILSHSTQRAKKDRYLREKAIKKLKEKIEKSKNVTKSDLKLSHYAKFLDLDDNCTIEFKINQEKISQDEKLDGIKGFITNDISLSHQEIIEHYKNLWQIERAFRISKTDLRIRPIYHRLQDRIKAHILISFVSYAVYKEFERRLKANNIDFNFSSKIIMDLIKSMKAIEDDNSFKLFNFNEYQSMIYNAVFKN